MIAEMDRVLVVGPKRIAQDLLVSLQNQGVVQIDPLEDDSVRRLKLSTSDVKAKEGWTAVLARTEGLLDTLGADVAQAPGKVELPNSLEDLRSYLNGVGTQTDERVAERSTLRDELEIINTYLPIFREVAPTLAQLEQSRYLYATAFLVPPGEIMAKLEAALNEAFVERYALATRPYGRETLVTVAVQKAERPQLLALLNRLGLAELRLPERYAEHGVAKAVHVMEERSQSLPKRLELLNQELEGLGTQHAAKLAALRGVALNHTTRYEALEALGEGRYSIALQGWVPTKETARVIETLQKQFGDKVVVETRHADEHHDHNVPVKLENAHWVQPFEGLLALFAPPQYGYFDPSWTLAVFFPLFFGIVVGDIGFGLMFLALGLWFRVRGANGNSLSLGPLGVTIPPSALPSIGTILNWCAAWSILWGFIYGEFFGNLLERLYIFGGKPFFYTTMHHEEGYGLVKILLFRVENFTPLLLLALAFGVLQVLGGWAIRAYYGYLHGDSKHFWEGVGMFAGLFATVVFAYAFLTERLGSIVWGIVGLGFGIFFLGVFLSGVVLMLVELISNSGNILSYLRLFAVGLSAALVANLATDLGFALSGVAPLIGPLLGILIGFTVHMLAIALTIIGHTLQPLRLQYVEFFTKFGFYEANGRPYSPFRLHGGKL